MEQNECQFPCLRDIAEGNVKLPPQSLKKRVQLSIKRNLSPSQIKALHKNAAVAKKYLFKTMGKTMPVAKVVPALSGVRLQAGDTVRVRTMEEIEAMLDGSKKTRGCAFMDGMERYCGTTQRVLKSMERFVDERELKVKKCNGIILLENVMCEGVLAFGRCDRCCLMFWREEWLEKIE
ncbi:hypothetical protein C8U37_102114 [Trichococcus patagoniensis]|uniref:Uncharacterized protein n=1 Tax=Trichococcus patagoniensis TaxID=382641 RepID=A0A2T5IQB5_9LACT|nr:hypothetical protein [Trichococcus patagoniensis]PTQ86011.1 hypothetical protein C8U37_102114 [Trichococcus patagoniensis]